MNKTKQAHIEFNNDIVITITKLWKTDVGKFSFSAAHFITDFQVYKGGRKIFELITNPIDIFGDLVFSNSIHRKTKESSNHRMIVDKDEGVQFYFKETFGNDMILGAELNSDQKEALTYWLGKFLGFKKKYISNKLGKGILLIEKVK